MKPLIDSDIILYEVGFGSQETKEDGTVEPRDWAFAQELLESKVKHICEMVGATEPPLFFLTNTPRINKILNKGRKRADEPQKEYVENFRVEAAKEKEYKGTRKADKPFHFYNLLAHIMGTYDCHIAENGIEADDAMCIMQYSRLSQRDTVICSRDKDLRQCPGKHFTWENGKQASWGPEWVEPLGFLEKRGKGIFGTGHKFFYAQMLIGDTTDNIGGVKGKGPAFAYNLLNDLETERECYEHVAEVYVKTYEDEWEAKFMEQASLLWMVREVNEDSSPKFYVPPPL